MEEGGKTIWMSGTIGDLDADTGIRAGHGRPMHLVRNCARSSHPRSGGNGGDLTHLLERSSLGHRAETISTAISRRSPFLVPPLPLAVGAAFRKFFAHAASRSVQDPGREERDQTMRLLMEPHDKDVRHVTERRRRWP